MCVNQRYITNRYTRKRILVKCGHCESCLQEKAVMRTNRIRNEYDPSRIVLFATLTYDRASCPFVLLDDIRNKNFPLKVYREFKVRKVRVCSDYLFRFKRVYSRQVLTEVPIKDYYGYTYYFKTLSHRHGKVGVCYFKDFQNFAKRFRVILDRRFGIKESIKLFDCFEYGERTQRPHLHVLFFIRPEIEAQVRSAICEAWPYASRSRTSDWIEIARDAAGYVSSYVNCGSSFPKFLRKNFRPKHSFSKHFGLSNKCFSLDSLLDKISKGTLEYDVLRDVAGIPVLCSVPVPSYVINRYFPIFKGYSRLPSVALCNYIYRIGNLTRDVYDNPLRHKELNEIGYTQDDIHAIGVRLRNAFKVYHNLTGRSRFRYAQDFVSAWKAQKMTRLKRFYENIDNVHWHYMYDNIASYYFGRLKNPSLDVVPLPEVVCWSYNELPPTVNRTLRMTKSYYSYLKTKDVNNAALRAQYDYV